MSFRDLKMKPEDKEGISIPQGEDVITVPAKFWMSSFKRSKDKIF